MRRLLIIIITCLGVGLLSERQAQAAGVALDEDMQTAVKTAPNGMTLSSLFSTKSNAQLVDGTFTKESIAQITNDNIDSQINEVGAFWSQQLGKTKAKVNLTHDTSWSFWLYFGNKQAKQSSGMAFVLQNDPEANGAIAKGGKGQSLGVWASDTNSGASASGLSQIAIQHSWALEFDTTVNKTPSPGAGKYYDAEGIPSQGPHIASGYPADASMYKQYGQRGKHYFALKHQQPKLMANPADGQWRHVTIDWKVQSSQMTYAFNDQDPKTRQPMKPEVQDTITIDRKKLSADGRTLANEVTWGITGSTGQFNSANQLVVLDQTPRQIQFSKLAETNIMQDMAVKRKIKEGDTVTPGETLRYVLHATAKNPTNSGTLTTATAMLPAISAVKRIRGHFTNDGIHALHPLNSQELLADRIDAQIANHAFSAATPSLAFWLKTEIQPVDHDVYVPPRKVIFSGVDHYVEVKSAGYTVKRKLNLKLENLDDSALSVEKGKDATVHARLSNDGKDINDDIIADTKVRIDVGGLTFNLSQLKGTWEGTSGKFQFKVPSRLLKPGKNNVSVRATNRKDEAQPLKIAVNQRSGDLAFDTMPCNCNFKGELNGKHQMIGRDKDWQLRVHDGRGAGSSWKLQLNVSKKFTTTDGRELSGNVVYRKGKTQQKQNIGAKPTVIEEQTTKEDDECTDVAQKWKDDDGVLIEVNGDAVAGDYSGELLWQLTDAP